LGEKRTIGRVERVSLLDFGITDITCRVDTGARTSALHVDRLLEVSEDFVVFELEHAHEAIRVRAPVARRSVVRTTSATRELRIVVRAHMRLGDVSRSIEVGLCRRDRLRHPMILGRSALSGVFIVDPARTHTDGRVRDESADTERFSRIARPR
jgi:hypothetical protein